MRRLDHDEVTSVFAEVRALPEARRTDFLDSRCSGRPELRREIEELLACDDSACAVFDEAATAVLPPDPSRVGPYELLEAVGEGGMAVVYRAQQHAPIRRVVAIKLIKLGMDTRRFVARFESERQALAMMDHPNIARVYDAGSTDSGRPYFAMEYVPGRHILRWCDEQQLTIHQRLELFIPVCEAVEHAHRKGIIHRDLKDSNVLVTDVDGRAIPKVIDFGVARTVADPQTDRTALTEHGVLLGTPGYMSPEQAERGLLDVDTRADVYSLGVLLYELIAGAQPIPRELWSTDSHDTVLLRLRDSEATRPATRLTELSQAEAQRIAAQRRMRIESLLRELRGELEWIPLKALRKDREQRYRSAAELADDVRNYLAGRPLIAGPEAARYRVGKFLRRHKRGVAALATIALLLVGGVVATTWQAVRATRAERNAQAALRRSEEINASLRAINHFLNEDVLWSADPVVTRGRDLTIRQVLDNAADDVAARFGDQPRLEATIRNTLAGAYRTLGQLDVAQAQSQAAVEIVRRIGMDSDADGLQILNDWGMVQFERGDHPAAERAFRETLLARRRLLGGGRIVTAESMSNLAAALFVQKKTDEARALIHDAMEVLAAAGASAETRSYPMARLAQVLLEQGRHAEAEAMLREALDQMTRAGGHDHPQSLTLRQWLARVSHAAGDFAQADKIVAELIPDQRRVLGDDHPETVTLTDFAATVKFARGDFDAADPLARDTLDRSRRLFGDDSPRTLARINNLARLQMYRGKLDEAERLFREALEACRRVRGDENEQTLAISLNLALLLMRMDKLQEAEPLLRHTLEMQQRTLGDDDVATVTSLNNLGGLLFQKREFAEAEPLFRAAVDGRRRQFGTGHPETLAVLSNLGRSIRAQSRHADAEPVFAELYRLTAASQAPARQAALYMSHWGPCLVELGRLTEAEPALREAHERLTRTSQTRGEHMQRVLAALATVCQQTGRADEAARWRDELSRITSATGPSTRPG